MPELASCLDAAGHLIEALGGPCGRLVRAEIHDLTCRLLDAVEKAAGSADKPAVSGKVLGLMLIELGHVTGDQVDEALTMHRAKGLPIGECLLLLGSISPDRLLDTLRLQERMRAMEEGLEPGSSEPPPSAPRPPNAAFRVTEEMFFGEVLLGAEMITNEQLEQAMRIHHAQGVRVGEALVGLGAVTEEEVQLGLELQRTLRHIAAAPAEH